MICLVIRANFAVLLNARASIALNTGYRKIGVLTLGVEQHTGIAKIVSRRIVNLYRSITKSRLSMGGCLERISLFLSFIFWSIHRSI